MKRRPPSSKRPATLPGRGSSARTSSHRRSPIHREWGGVVPELASRQHIRDICGVVERALRGLGDVVAVYRRDCRHPGTRARRLAAGRRVVREGGGRGCRRAAYWRPSPGGPHRIARPAERRDAAAGGRARRLWRAHEPLSRDRSRSIRAPQPDARRRGGRGVRQGGEAARPRLSRRSGDRPARRDRQRSRGSAADDAADARGSERSRTQRRSRFQLQRPEDGGASLREGQRGCGRS